MAAKKKEPKTIIVALQGSGSCPSITQLRPVFKSRMDSNTTIVIHRDPLVTTDDEGIHANFDLLITTGTDFTDDPIYHTGDNAVVSLTREAKDIQIIQMNLVAKRYRIESFIPQILFSTGKNSPRNNWGGASLHGEVIVKPTYGARGVGHVKLNADHYPIGNLSRLFDDDSITWNDVEKRLREDGLSITSRENFSPGEHIHMARFQGMVITAYIPDIESEYRLLVNPSGEILVYDRVRDDVDGYWRVNNEAKSVLVDGKTTELALHPVLGVHNDDIRLMLRGLNLEYGAIDIFVKGGKWGMFEYSNEFGMVGNNIVEMRDFHEEAVSAWVDNLKKERSK